jgi:DNA-binding LacI/PurR family transcriptional regulator
VSTHRRNGGETFSNVVNGYVHVTRHAVDLPAQRMASSAGEPREVRVPYRLVIRESTSG